MICETHYRISRQPLKDHTEVVSGVALFFMTYSAVYCALIERRRQHSLQDGVYGEVHHIIPKSEGGDDSKENLVRLSAREHYVAHLLLAKIYNDFKMYSASTYMQTHRHKNRVFKFNSRLYEKLREEFGKKHSEYMKKHYIKEKHWNYGKHWSEEDKEKQRIAHKGQKAWNKGIPMSKESKKKLSINNGSKRQEVREKISKTATGTKWWNNGIIQCHSKECPPGFVAGRLKKKKQ